jgi:hypothetical protein
MMDMGSEASNSEGNRQIGRKNWLSELGLDAAKLGLLLYVLGLLASSLYYSRFSIARLCTFPTASKPLGRPPASFPGGQDWQSTSPGGRQTES